MIISLKDEFIEYIFDKIENENYLEFDGCFCSSGEFYIGDINGARTYLCISTACNKSGRCNNDFYSADIFFAQQCLDEVLLEEYRRWYESEDVSEPEGRVKDIFIHNYEDIDLIEVYNIKLDVMDDLLLRKYFYGLYMKMYNIDPLAYDKNFEI